MSLSLGGRNASTGLYVISAGDDGKSGCNLTGSATATFAVASSDTGAATVTPSAAPGASTGGNATTISGNQFTLRRCSSGPSDPLATLTVQPVGAGSADISISLVANTSTGAFNVAPARFTAVVAPPPNTAPIVRVTGVSEASAYANGSVPTPGCSVTDTEDGLSGSTSAASPQLSAVSGAYASDGIGLQTATCSYTDGGGLTTSVSATYSIFDQTAPVVEYEVDPASPEGLNGWFTGDVTLTWAVAETESPNSLVKVGCIDRSITADQAEETYSCSATSAGGSAGSVSVSIKRDAHAPGVECDHETSGWLAANVVLNCTAGDVGPAGLAAVSDASFTLSTAVASGEESSAAPTDLRTLADKAGNLVTAGPYFFMVDRRAPAVECEVAPDGWHSADIEIQCTAADGGSGLAVDGDEGCALTTSVPEGSETADASTSAYEVCDAVGNCVTVGPITGLMVDKKAPSVECDAPALAWSAADVSRACTASDGGAGVAPASDESFTLVTDMPAGTESDDAQTDAKTILDAVGNASAAGPLGGNKVDKKAPVVACDDADHDLGMWYATNQEIVCSSSDQGSGLADLADAGFTLATNVAVGDEDDGASTGHRVVVDAVGNTAVQAGPFEFKIDRKAPVVACGTADDAWHAYDVAISCSAADGGSGLANDAHVTFELETSVSEGTESANASTASRAVADAVGNSAMAGPIAGNKVDKRGPGVTVVCPASIVKGAPASADWSAVDFGSGVAGASAGSISLDTSTIGTHTFAAPAGTAMDAVANESAASDACSYSVVYAWRGFFSPVDNKDTNGNYILNKAKSGSTIPVKFSLGGSQGMSIFPPGYPMSTQIPCTLSSVDVIEDYSTATVSGLKYDAAAEQYVYNWKTASAWAGTCRQLVVKLDDGTFHRANFHFVR